MELMGPNFTRPSFATSITRAFEKISLFAGVSRASRTGFATLRRAVVTAKERWNAAELRAARIERRMDEMKREQFPLFFGRHRIF